MHYSWPRVPSAVYNEKSWKSSQSRAAVFSWRPSFAYRSVPRDRHPNKNICTRGDFHPSLRACLRSAVLISGNTPRRKVCFTTFPPPAEPQKWDADHLVRGIWSGLTERNGRVCQTVFHRRETRKEENEERGRKKQRKGACLEYIEDDQWRLDLQ